MTYPHGLTYRPAGGMVAALTLGFGLYILVSAIAALSTWSEIGLLQSAIAGAEITQAEANASDLRQGLLGLASLGLFLAISVVFCVWIYRANKNARALGSAEMRFSPGWCIGWFFVPIMHLFKPYQAVAEIWRASDPQADALSWKTSRSSGVVGTWWAFWIMAAILGQASLRLSMHAESLEAAVGASWFGLLAWVSDIPLTVCTIAVVRGIHDRQQRKSRDPQSGEQAFPIPQDTTSWAA